MHCTTHFFDDADDEAEANDEIAVIATPSASAVAAGLDRPRGRGMGTAPAVAPMKNQYNLLDPCATLAVWWCDHDSLLV